MIERFVKYLKILWKGITGIAVELVYPLITFSAAAILSFSVYLFFLVKK